ncbi:helix-turn-helix domain-containing protein [Flagellimonas allohymeniacidonis]|uniref:AraC family transcriptional regulator n=1 Tax=Flagellimonas allohymeniacidonis TaxID=2517819 RepID=A0A4Q8Q998_9FLAO|nr:helix-turn-helix domain-containing protein [Allomuricauda hymeniacidonis]TAI46835.1 AraC family transcriptional regulator [Allomuricauda hymeniacidonis]
MEFNWALLFFFSALGAFNGLCLGLYFLLIAKPKHISSKFLGVLLLMMSVRIGKSVFFYFKPDLAFIYLQLGITACFFIGPFLYFYVKSVVQPNSSIVKNWKYHLAILIPFILIIGIIYPFETHVDLWRPYIVYGIYLQWLAYILISGWVLRGDLKQLFYRSKSLKTQQVWLLSIFLGNLMIWAAYFFTNFTYYIVGALTFSFLFYLLALLVFINRKKKSHLFIPEQKYADKRIATSEAKALLDKLTQLVENEEPFTNANLKSSDIAKKMQLSVHQLSQLLNDNLGKSFPIFINEHRIAKAQKMLASNDILTLEAIGYECGFNSKSTFYTTFKKITGSTPAQYKAQLRGSYL